MKNNILKFRIKFLILHPILVLKYLFSKRDIFSEISIEELKSLVESPKLILEAGAADGVDTQKLAIEFDSAYVYALEPVVDQFNYLKIKLNLLKNVFLFPFALNNQSQFVEINIGKSGTGLGGMGSSSLLQPTLHRQVFPEIDFGTTLKVEAIRLDDFYKKYMPQNLIIDLLWLDLQGMEYKIIKSTLDFLINKVKFIQLEASRIELYSGSFLFKDIHGILKQNNFKLLLNRVGAISGNALYRNLNL